MAATIRDFTISVSTATVVSFPVDVPQFEELDLLIAWVTRDGTGNAVSPANWIDVVNQSDGGAREVGAYRIAYSGEPTTYAWTTSATDTWSGSIISIKDVDFGTPATFQTQTGVNGTTEVVTTDAAHGFATGDAVFYLKRGGGNAVGLTDGNLYFARNLSSTTISLHVTAAEAVADTNRVNLTAAATDETHYIYDADFWIDQTTNSTDAGGFDVTSPSITTVADDCLVMRFVGADGNVQGSISNGPGTHFLFAFDAGTPGQACSYHYRETGGSVGTHEFRKQIADSKGFWTVSIKGAQGSGKPGYVDASADLGTVLNPLHAITNTAYNNVYEDPTTVSPTITSVASRTVSYDVAAATVDAGLNQFESGINISPAAGANWQGSRLDFGTGSAPGTVDLSPGVILGTVYVPSARDSAYDMSRIREVGIFGGMAIVLQDTDGDWKAFQIAAQDGANDPFARMVFGIAGDADTEIAEGATFNPNAVRRVVFLIHCPRGAVTPVYSMLVKTGTLVMHGGNEVTPAGVTDLFNCGNSYLFPLVNRLGDGALLAFCPVTLGGSESSYIDLRGGSLQFPGTYSIVTKALRWHGVADGVSNSLAFTIDLNAGDTIEMGNFQVSSVSKFTWQIAAGSSASATYRTAGHVCVGADPVTLRAVATWAGMTFAECGPITLNAAVFEDSVISDSVSPLGALIIASATESANLARLSFVDNNDGDLGHSIQISAAGTYTFDEHTFSGGGPVHFGFHTQNDVDAPNDEIDHTSHGYTTGDAVYYQDQSGSDTIGLTDGNLYYVRAVTADALAFYATKADAEADTSRIGLSDGAAGQTHYLYSAKADVYIDAAVAVTINVTNGGDSPSVRLANGATVTVNASVSVQITVLDVNNDPIQDVRVSMYRISDGLEILNEDTNASGIADGIFSGTTPANIKWRCRKGSSADNPKYITRSGVGVIPSTGFDLLVTMDENPNNNA